MGEQTLCDCRSKRESQISSDFAQTQLREKEEEEEIYQASPQDAEMATTSTLSTTLPIRVGREAAAPAGGSDSAAPVNSWEDGPIAWQNRAAGHGYRVEEFGGSGQDQHHHHHHRHQEWSDHMLASSKQVLRRLASMNTQYRMKKVDADSHVFETYHDSFLYGRVPFPLKIRASIRGGIIGYIWHIVCTFMTTLPPLPLPPHVFLAILRLVVCVHRAWNL